MSKGSDELIEDINESLPSRWILNSITVTEADEYSVLLCPRGPVPIRDFGRVYGRGASVRDALANALEKLAAFLGESTDLDSSAMTCSVMHRRQPQSRSMHKRMART